MRKKILNELPNSSQLLYLAYRQLHPEDPQFGTILNVKV